MSCTPPFFDLPNANATNCFSPLVRSVVSISNASNGFSNFLNSYNNSIFVVNSWNMAAIPWGKAIFLTYESNNTYSSNGPSAINLVATYSVQGQSLVNVALGAAALGKCNGSNYAFGMIRSQAQVSPGSNFSVSGYGPEPCTQIIPAYIGTVICCGNQSIPNTCNNVNFSSNVIDLMVPNWANSNAQNLAAKLTTLDQTAVCVSLLFTRGGNC